MRILMVSSYLPYPLFSGGHIRLYNLIKNLNERHEITLVCEKRENQNQNDINEVSKICKRLVVIERKKQWSLGNVIKTGFSMSPFLVTGHKNPQMRQALEKLLSTEQFDLVHVETFYVMQNLPAGKAGFPQAHIPIVLVEHNVEHLVYERFVKKAMLLLRPLLFIDVLKLKRLEKAYWGKADKLIAVSPKEAKLMGRDAEIIPNGVDIEKFKMKKIDKTRKKIKVLFIGDFRWIQNRDSVVYIIKNVWPRVISKNPNLTLWIVGKNIPESLKKLANPSIIFDEDAPDETEQIFQSADVLLSPIRIGGGTNFKILESMASGTPVITTSLGNEGIEAKNGEEIILCEKPEEFINKTLLLLSDDYLYEKISRNARKFVEKNFDWKNIAQKLENVYQSLTRNS
ncbi:MAG: glycosyltransferase family 4 protein [Candidatus Levybacteria bacterium]|nr:glycosyltransferase family 4 protein [Candidatus Levybacteria bacterium]